MNRGKKLEIYNNISKIYDLSMEDVNYDSWFNLIKEGILYYNADVKNILELGCGSGIMSEKLLEFGYEVVGIDISDQMLDIAKEKLQKFGENIILIQQDINEIDFEIYEIDMILAVNDVFNYMEDENSLTNLINFSYEHLKKDGILFFDISTEYKMKNILDGRIFSEEFDNIYYVWKNFFDDKEKKLQIEIDIFENISNDIYLRSSEDHIQRAYDYDKIIKILKNSGFSKVECFSDFDKTNKNYDKASRIFFFSKK